MKAIVRFLQMALAAAIGAVAVLLVMHWIAKADDKFIATPVPAMMVPVSFAGVIDDRARFRRIFCSLNEDHGARFQTRRPCEAALQRLAGEGSPNSEPVLGRSTESANRFHIVIIPGVFGMCVRNWALPLEDAAVFMRRKGYRVDIVDVDGRSSSARNAAIIADTIPRLLKPGERLLIIGYSKGMSDVLETLSLHPQAIPPGSAVVSLSGVVSGTPLANHAAGLDRVVSALPLPRCPTGDKAGVESLSPRYRLAWLASHPLPRDRTYFSIASLAEYAHVSWPLKQTYRQLSTVYGPNDGQVPSADAIIPGSHLLGYLNADHWAVALPLTRNVPALRPILGDDNDYPREILLETIVRSVEEAFDLKKGFLDQINRKGIMGAVDGAPRAVSPLAATSPSPSL